MLFYIVLSFHVILFIVKIVYIKYIISTFTIDKTPKDNSVMFIFKTWQMHMIFFIGIFLYLEIKYISNGFDSKDVINYLLAVVVDQIVSTAALILYIKKK